MVKENAGNKSYHVDLMEFSPDIFNDVVLVGFEVEIMVKALYLVLGFETPKVLLS
jgi:hypothetical protein